MWTAALLALCSLLPSADPATDPHRQFDFWLGEWSIQNRHTAPDGTWADGDVTRARITPVCGERAVLEEWAGPLRGSFMNGFSLRAWDPEHERWALLLFWTTDGNADFGLLHGTFRHGRGEFFAGSTRYTFSDALANSVRWDSATTADDGVTWKTDWIMEFSRSAPRAATTQERLFEVDWTDGALSPHPEARALDWLVGTWNGTQTDADGDEREARLRARHLLKDCLVLDLLETRAPGADGWDERLCVRGYVARKRAWESWSVDEADTVLRRATSVPGDVAVFERPTGDGAALQEVLIRGDDDHVVIEVNALEKGQPRLVRSTALTRVR